MLSIICPSRDRLALLEGFLTSIAETAYDPAKIEVLIALDGNDEQSLAAVPRLKRVYNFLRFWSSVEEFGSVYYNRLAGMSSGRAIWALNDDCCIQTKHWDKLIPEDIWYGKTSQPDENRFASFPILGRQAVKLQGYFFHPFFRGWGADQGLCHVWRALGRCQELNIHVDHLSYHSSKRQKDKVNEDMAKISQHFHTNPGRFFAQIAPGEIERLSKLISETRE